VVSPQSQREAVLVMQVEGELSQRRACGLIEMHRATCRYRRRRPEEGGLRVRLRELAEVRRRFGYRRLQVLLQREGWQVNHKRVYRRRSYRCGASAGESAARCASRSDNGPEFVSRIMGR
jgi:putative transposase